MIIFFLALPTPALIDKQELLYLNYQPVYQFHSQV
ncbi:hypothetical protein EV199_1953 [Pseudobacter ginsenosidimutans]|uniref:Uncharacterized protein n=1 Tax=Pseudobacter ginsenosidimutans TaxID=661488 RepID=A0A4Q7N4X9_9BACT|nr:hypothetical protein EV199_1953 [Pseudobacter ginsenosidimutans]